MKITYLGHSGFSVETESALLVFDCIGNELPQRPDGKKLVFFVSHWHDDHYSERIFSCADDPNVSYILDSGITHYPENVKINFVSDRKTYTVGDMTVKTLRSTDCGVAYLVKLDGHKIYHAGDLHLWLWSGASLMQRKAVRYAFETELSTLTDENIDVAFLPLDPRQEGEGSLGFEYAMQNLKIKCAVPMHFWNDTEYVKRFAEKDEAKRFASKICLLLNVGDSAETV